MAVLRRDADGHGECDGAHVPDDKCMMCGSPGDAAWYTSPPVVVCFRCAVDILPRLIADAMAGFHSRGGPCTNLYYHGLQNEKDVLVHFWKAVSAAQRPRHA